MSEIAAKTIQTKSGKPVTIRTGERLDAAALIANAKNVMSEKIYSLTQADEFNPTWEEEVEWIQRLRDGPSSLLLVAEMENQIVGNIDFTPGHRRLIAHTGEFGMSVNNEARDQGIGDALLKSLIEWASAHPTLEKIELKVHATNARAIALYRANGFAEEGRQVRNLKCGENEYIDTLLMGKFVKPQTPAGS